MNHFPHEELEVYQVAMDFAVAADKLARQLPRGRRYLAPPLLRASIYIPMYVAGGEVCDGQQKAVQYRKARQAAADCADVLTMFAAANLVDRARLAEAQALLQRLQTLLTVTVVWRSRPGAA